MFKSTQQKCTYLTLIDNAMVLLLEQTLTVTPVTVSNTSGFFKPKNIKHTKAILIITVPYKIVREGGGGDILYIGIMK